MLLTNAYFYRFDTKQWENQRPYPPYGTIYTASLLRQNGYNVELFDTNLRKDPKEIIPFLEAKPDYLVIYDDGFNYLSKMCLSRMRDAAFELITLAKGKVKHIIVCSSDSTDHAAKYLEVGADYIILGEGELTLQELLKQLQTENFQADSILGISYHDGVQVIRNPNRPVLKELDSLPDPAWDMVDIDAYRKIWVNSHGYFALNIATTRGCPYKCNWCAKPIYGQRYNSRSPKRVATEIAMQINKNKADYFWVCDDIFGLKPGWVQTFQKELVALNVSPKFMIQSRVDLLLKEDNIEALAAAGLDEVWVGAESGSQKILDAMDKGTQIEQIYTATKLLKSKGIRVAFFLQFGYIDEQWEDIQKTIQMLMDLVPDDIGISVSYPLPETKFYDMVKAQLKEKQNWTDSDDLAMMYEATFSPDFYRRLHSYVHKRFRLKQGWQFFKQLFSAPSKISFSRLRLIAAMGYYLPAALLDWFKLYRLRA